MMINYVPLPEGLMLVFVSIIWGYVMGYDRAESGKDKNTIVMPICGFGLLFCLFYSETRNFFQTFGIVSMILIASGIFYVYFKVRRSRKNLEVSEGS